MLYVWTEESTNSESRTKPWEEAGTVWVDTAKHQVVLIEGKTKQKGTENIRYMYLYHPDMHFLLKGGLAKCMTSESDKC